VNTDIRISVTFLQNPKIKKLERRVGLEGLKALLALWIWTAQNKPTGDLAGLDDESVEMAADWVGEDGAFVQALKALRLLDGEEGSYCIHDWVENNGWAANESDRADTSRFNRMKGVPAYKEIHETLAEAGVSRISKEDYELLRNSGERQAVVKRLLKNASSTSKATSEKAPRGREASPGVAPSTAQATLNNRSSTAPSVADNRLSNALSPSPTPTPSPSPIPRPSPMDTHKEACAPRPFSPEDVEEAKDGIRREAEAVRQEFDELREAYKAVRDDGPMAGWPEYQQARRSKGWPGLLFVLDRLQTLIEQDDQWKRGYKEGLRRFLTDRMWEIEPRKAAPAPNAEPEKTAEDRALDEKIAKMRAEMKAKEAARKKAARGW